MLRARSEPEGQRPNEGARVDALGFAVAQATLKLAVVRKKINARTFMIAWGYLLIIRSSP